MDKKENTKVRAPIKSAFIKGVMGFMSIVTEAIVSGIISKNAIVNQIISQIQINTVDIENINDLIDNYNHLCWENLQLKENNYELDLKNEELKEEKES